MNKHMATAGVKTKSFAVFFAKSGKFVDGLSRFSHGGQNETITLSEFHADYAYVGTFSGETADDVFAELQDGGGNLGIKYGYGDEVPPSKETVISGSMMQELLIRAVGHTSMSKGDVAVDLSTGAVMLCASSGWDAIAITGMRPIPEVR